MATAVRFMATAMVGGFTAMDTGVPTMAAAMASTGARTMAMATGGTGAHSAAMVSDFGVRIGDIEVLGPSSPERSSWLSFTRRSISPAG